MSLALHQKLIYQCSRVDIDGGGGVETYLRTLINSPVPSLSQPLISCLKNLDQRQPQLLHIHDPEMLMEVTEECPAIFTMHNHCSYCPSGTKYLANRGKVCDRMMNPLGCSWGHLIDSCGSRRPQKLLFNFLNTYHFIQTLKKLKIPVIANSDYVRGQIISAGVAAERVVTLRCGVKPPRHPTTALNWATHKNQRILFVGRIVPDKGVEWLIKALQHTNTNIHLDIAGDGWSKSSMEKLASAMGLSNRITWHGWCNDQHLEALYQQCFAVVFPSLWPEPAGLVTLEAYSHYRPIIASAVGGIPEHVKHGETGILVRANHVQELATAINELATNYSQSRLMGERGEAWYQEEFTIDIHLQRLLEIYRQTIAHFHQAHSSTLPSITRSQNNVDKY